MENKPPRDSFDQLEHLEKVAAENGVTFSESEKTAMLLKRMDIKSKSLILEHSITNPHLIKKLPTHQGHFTCQMGHGGTS